MTSPGWDAIDAKLDVLYPDQQPQHFGTLLKYRLGGKDPLDGVSFYARTEPVPHWHVITYGMSELYEKTSANAEESGWGFEFTFRLARAAEDTEPPMWAADLLQNLARYVYTSGNWFGPGHHLNANGPIAMDHETRLTALVFAADPELATIGTPNGRLQFLQVVGLTTDEYAAAQQWDAVQVLGLLAGRSPLLITDLARPSLLEDPDARTAIEEGTARDGSSMGLLHVAGFTWSATPADDAPKSDGSAPNSDGGESEPDGGASKSGGDASSGEKSAESAAESDKSDESARLTLRFKAINADGIASAVRSRLPHGRDLRLIGDEEAYLVLKPGDADAAHAHDSELELTLTPTLVDSLLAALRPGTHELTPTLTVEVQEPVTA